jgi:hypothetical protein
MFDLFRLVMPDASELDCIPTTLALVNKIPCHLFGCYCFEGMATG